jgi:IS1 family transposase
LYDKVKHLKDCTFYTDRWNAFAEVLPSERHVIGKAHTMALNATIATRAIIWGDLQGAQKLFQRTKKWLTCPYAFGAR